MCSLSGTQTSSTKGRVLARWAFRAGDWNPSPELLDRLLRYVQPEEHARIKRFRFAKDARLALVGRLMMRAFLSRHLNVAWSSIVLRRTPENKPYLDSPCPTPGRALDFNVSHHGEWTVLAAFEASCDDKAAIGVDVMRIEPSHIQGETTEMFLKSFRRQFTDREWDYITGSEKDEIKLARFYRYWCLKESYVKAVGKGLHIDLRTIEFVVSDEERDGSPSHAAPLNDVTITTILYTPPPPSDGKRVDSCTVRPAPWIFEESRLDEDHCLAVCIPFARSNGRENVYANLAAVRFVVFDRIEKLLERAEDVAS